MFPKCLSAKNQKNGGDAEAVSWTLWCLVCRLLFHYVGEVSLFTKTIRYTNMPNLVLYAILFSECHRQCASPLLLESNLFQTTSVQREISFGAQG